MDKEVDENQCSRVFKKLLTRILMYINSGYFNPSPTDVRVTIVTTWEQVKRDVSSLTQVDAQRVFHEGMVRC